MSKVEGKIAMKIVEINSVCKGSTGSIMLGLAKTAHQNADEVYTFSAPRKENPPEGHRYFGSSVENMLHRMVSVFSGISGTGSVIGTWRLLRKIKKIDPDILHLHNLHGWYINLPMLFRFIKKHHIKTVWTLHDCWGFTAQCSHFVIEKCDKWKTGCYSCPRYRLYPYTFVDRTKKMWKLKKAWFNGVEDLTLVTPSRWLADLVKQSFLGAYDVRVINNGIDLDAFKPVTGDFREKYGIWDKKVVLGVASGWGYRKGLDVFTALSERLPEDYKIVLVGTNNEVDKQLPPDILSIHRTYNREELAQIYSAADVFVNPTREEVLGLVNIEALACGTPSITFQTGGSPETVDQTSGCVVPCDDMDELVRMVIRTCEENPFDAKACRMRAELFGVEQKNAEYMALYHEMLAQQGVEV